MGTPSEVAPSEPSPSWAAADSGISRFPDVAFLVVGVESLEVRWVPHT
jgi:hypothetical protein